MKSIKYSPKARRKLDDGSEGPVWSGSVTLKLPNYRDRLRLVKDLNFKVNEKGEVEYGASMFEAQEKIIGVVETHVENVDLTRVEDGMEFKNIDDLGYDVDGTELINELAFSLINGVRLGK